MLRKVKRSVLLKEKDGFLDVLQQIRSMGYGEMLTVSQVAEIAFNNLPNPAQARRSATRLFSGWVGERRGKMLPAVVLANQMC